jgi:cytidylate kinase
MRLHHGECSYYLEAEDVSKEIRGHRVTDNVSRYSALAPVRRRLVVLQRQMAEGLNVVCEGRDVGSFVFPKARLKIFLAGDDQVRAERRYQEICRRFPEEAAQTTLEQIKKEIFDRDNYDKNRAISPLIQPIDAIVIDTSELSIDEVVQAIIDYKDNMSVSQEGKL